MNDAEVTLYSTLGVETNEVDHIAGKTVVDNHKIAYDVQDEKGEYFITLNIDDYTLEAWVDFTTETLVHKGYDAVLTKKQKAALLSFVDQFGEALVTTNGNTPSNFEIGRMEFSFVKTLEFWSNAPQGYIYGNKTFVSNVDAKVLGNDGIRCVRRGTSYALEYDEGDNGRVYRTTKRAGYDASGIVSGYGCMGRCGINCGNWWIPSAWTLDCFEHDECGLRLKASGGTADPNCGDEFDEAADDYLFGVVRGCSG